MNQKSIGDRGEQLAAWYLRAKGYRIIERNFRVRGGEIDIICRDRTTLVFVEVKTRRSVLGGYPEEMVTPKKLERLRIAIGCYLQSHHRLPNEMRIDVVSVEQQKLLPHLMHFKNITENIS